MPTSDCWQAGRFQIDLNEPKIMGIVNLTPDSFSDGGRYVQTRAAVKHCEQLLLDGAHILDLGAESSRPGVAPLPLQAELERLLPVLREAVKLGVPVSVDTYKPELMQIALDNGADIINDIWSLRQPGARQTIAAHPACGVCLMHMHGQPQTMQLQPMQGQVLAEIIRFLDEQSARLLELGVDRRRLVLDPGIGFGKTVAQNFSILSRQEQFLTLGFPLLLGWSRKSSLGAALQTLGRGVPKPQERVIASVSAALLSVQKGARIVRVHDVWQTAQALAVYRQTV